MPVPSRAEANVPSAPRPGPQPCLLPRSCPAQGWSGLPSAPPSFFILVMLKGTSGTGVQLVGSPRHLGVGWGDSCFHAEKPQIIKEKGPTSGLWSVFLPQTAAASCRATWDPSSETRLGLHPLPASWRPDPCLPCVLLPARLWLKPKPPVSAALTPQAAPQSEEPPSGPRRRWGEGRPVTQTPAAYVSGSPPPPGVRAFLTRDKRGLRWGREQESGRGW